MKFLVLSDSHGSTKEIQQLKEQYEGIVQRIIHCGDSELEVTNPLLDGINIVNGNCDFRGTYPDEVIIEEQGVRIFVTHGHLYGIHQGLHRLFYKGKEVDADIVLFGHSHVYGAEEMDGILFVNPGSVLLPRIRKEKSYVILDVEESKITTTFYEIDGKVISQFIKDRS